MTSSRQGSRPGSVDVEQRLRAASALGDLTASRRLDAKVDRSPDAVRRRLMEAASLLDACAQLAALAR